MKDFTYNQSRWIARGDDEMEAADCFTEADFNSTNDHDLLKNVSSKSIILAPFNSTKSQISSFS